MSITRRIGHWRSAVTIALTALLMLSVAAIQPATAEETSSPPSSLEAFIYAYNLDTYVDHSSDNSESAVTQVLGEQAQKVKAFLDTHPTADSDARIDDINTVMVYFHVRELNTGESMPTNTETQASTEAVLDSIRALVVQPDPVTPDLQALSDKASALVSYLQDTIDVTKAEELLEDAKDISSNLSAPDVILPGIDTDKALSDADGLIWYFGQIVTNTSGDFRAVTTEQALESAGDLSQAYWSAADASAEPAVDKVAVADAADAALMQDTTPRVTYISDTDGEPISSGVKNIEPEIPGGFQQQTGSISTPTSTSSITNDGTSSGGCYKVSGICLGEFDHRGGPVQHFPKVYAVYWGPQWNTSLSTYRSNVNSFLSGLSGSSYQKLMMQYYDGSSYPHEEVTFGGTLIDPSTPPTTITDAAIIQELHAIQEARHWPVGIDVQWMIFLQKDSNIPGACGYHDAVHWKEKALPHSVIEFPTSDNRCMWVRNNTEGSLTHVASHEYAETVTNPMGRLGPEGWNDGYEEGEIADICDMAPSVPGPGGQLVNPLWSLDGNHPHCGVTFTPRWSYRVIQDNWYPVGDPYARGHSYDYSKVEVQNTGNMPWFRNRRYSGDPKVELGVEPLGTCSHLYVAKDVWRNCERLIMPFFVGEPARAIGSVESTKPSDSGVYAINFNIKADGKYVDNQSIVQEFGVVIDRGPGAVTTMSRSEGSRPSLRDSTKKTAIYSGQSLVTTTPYVAGGPGQDVVVQAPYLVGGSATWYRNESVWLATKGDASSDLASASWPKNTKAACSRCRATAVVGHDVPPLAQHTFQFRIHIPSSYAPGSVHQQVFVPVVDVPIVGGGVSTREIGNDFPLVIVVTDPDPGMHDLNAAGGFVNLPRLPNTDSLNATFNGREFYCGAVASPDAKRTRIESCVLTVSYGDGTTKTYSAPSSANNSFWAFTGTVGLTGISGTGADGTPGLYSQSIDYDQARGDKAQLCWVARTVYMDDKGATRTGCVGT